MNAIRPVALAVAASVIPAVRAELAASGITLGEPAQPADLPAVREQLIKIGTWPGEVVTGRGRVRCYHATGPAVIGSPEIGPPDLTRHEIELLRLISKGMSNIEIARSLDVKDAVIKIGVARVCRKLRAKGRVHAVAIALRHGLLGGGA